jgi:hypothetical protein
MPVATYHIVLLILGAIAMVITVYFVYKILYDPSINEQECRVRMSAWCAKCETNGGDPSLELEDCAEKFYGMSDFDFDCDSAKDRCKAFLPITP